MPTISSQSLRLSNARALLRSGSALALVVAAAPALAQPITQTSTGDITVTAASASGTPVAVDLSSTAGTIKATVTAATGSAASGQRDNVVGLETGSNGAIKGTFSTITGTGQGQLLGIAAETYGGAITLDLGTVDVAGTASAGVYARSVDGAVAINAGSVISRGTGEDSQHQYYEAIYGASDNGSVTIVAKSAETYGIFGSAIGAVSGGLASITADSVTSHSAGSVTAYAIAAGNTSGKFGTVTNTATNGQGVTIQSNGGAASLTATTIKVGDFARGAYILGASGASADIGSITGGSGLRIDAPGGNIAAKVGAIDVYANAINATAHGFGIALDLGTVTSRNSDASTIVAGTESVGTVMINVNKASGAGIDRGTIVADAGAGKITITGGEVIASGDGGVGVIARAASGDIAISLGKVTATGLQIVNNHTADGIFAQSGSGRVDVTLTSGSAAGQGASVVAAIGGKGVGLTVGDALAAGAGAAALHAESGSGDAVIKAGTVTLTGDSQIAAQAIASGAAQITVAQIRGEGTLGSGAFAQGGKGAAITAGSTLVERNGLRALALNGSAATIAATGNTVADTGYAIYGSGGTVGITTAAGTTTSGATYGIRAASTGSAAITAGGTVTATGTLGNAIAVAAPGQVDVTANVVTVTGAGAFPGLRADGSGYRIEQGGIIVEGGAGPIAIQAGSVDVAGQERYGISARGSGAITIAANAVKLASGDSVAVVARGGAGNVALTTGTVTTTGASGVGVFGTTTSGAVNISAGTTRVENAGQLGLFTGDAVVGTSQTGQVSIVSQNAFSAALGGSAVVAQSGGSVSVKSTIAQTTGNGGIALLAASTNGNATLESGSLSLTGANVRAVRVSANAGTATARLGDVTALGANATGALVSGRVVDVSVTGALRTSGTALALSGGATQLTVSGSLTSLSDAALTTNTASGQTVVAAGGSLSGTTGALLLAPSAGGGTNAFVNHGTVRGTNGVGVLGANSSAGTAPAAYRIYNDGVLVGGGGIAVLTAAGDDVLELGEGSQITGLADLGAGNDKLILSHAATAPVSAIGSVASTRNVEALILSSGTWRAAGPSSQYESVRIENGGRLIVAQDALGYSSIVTPRVELQGRLDLDLAGDTEPGDLTGIVFTGAGSLHLTGEAAVLIDDASGLQYTGGTFVDNGTLVLTGTFGGKVVTSGDGTFQLGNGGTGGGHTGDIVNDGRFVYARSDNYTLSGSFTGTGLLEKLGSGRLTFGGFYGFDGTTTVRAGSIAFAGALAEDTELQLQSGGTFDLSQVKGGQQTIAELSGTGGTLALGGTDLTVDQDDNTVFAGAITGSGDLVKTGTGDLKLNGDGTAFTGTGLVSGGTLSLNGAFQNANFVVVSGGTLGGNGTLGPTSVNGGTIGAGNSIGQLTIAGDLTLTSTSTVAVEVNAAGQADRIIVGGRATLGGAKVSVLAAAGQYRAFTDYTILTAAGGVSGTFGGVTSNLAFLDPYLTYAPGSVTLRLVRNNVAFASLAATPNQVAIAGLIQSYKYGNTLYNETLTLVDAGVPGSFATLTGDVYPTYGGALIETAEILRHQASAAMAGQQGFIWATGLYNRVEGGAGAGAAQLNGTGVAGGLGFGANGFSVAAGVGRLDADGSGGSVTGSTVNFLIGQAGFHGQGGLSIGAGVQYGWFDGDTSRFTMLGSINRAVTGKTEGHYSQLFADIGWQAALGSARVEPFAGISRVALDLDATTETGAATALQIGASERKVTFARFGVRLSGDGAGTVRPYASAAYRHAWGDRASLASVGFAGLGGSAQIGGIPIARGAGELEAGLTVRTGALDLQLGYRGMVSSQFDSHGLNLGVRIRF
jgi:uncharacterized protein with beta-barrel porin domain